MMTNALSLYELNNRIRSVLDRSMDGRYWLQAELSEVRIATNGHCYVEFVQKDLRSNALIAKARGTIWANIFTLLRPYFERETGQAFTAGIKVLVEVKVEFHELYGYSLTVTDIDPAYTLGDMARLRRDILRQLEEEGVLTLNKELPMPRLPQRIAVISAASAAGYGDFCNQLHNNPYGLVFYPHLFPAIMQGERVEASIIEALNAINETISQWDVVVIIRGGGAVSDLSGFDTYLLAANCAQFPIPIITGIGHERDDTVIDMVAHTRVKTPTAAAEFLINRIHEEALLLENWTDYIYNKVENRLKEELYHLQQLTARLPATWAVCRTNELRKIEMLQARAQNGTEMTLQREKHRLQMLEQRVDACDIQKILKRGFSLTLLNGRTVTDASVLKPGDRVVSRFAKGEATLHVAQKTNETNQSIQ